MPGNVMLCLGPPRAWGTWGVVMPPTMAAQADSGIRMGWDILFVSDPGPVGPAAHSTQSYLNIQFMVPYLGDLIIYKQRESYRGTLQMLLSSIPYGSSLHFLVRWLEFSLL